MAQKRPFDDVVNEVSSKHPRQDGPNNDIISSSDNLSLGGGSEKRYDSGEASIRKDEMKFQEYENGSCPTIEDSETDDDPRYAALSHWAASSTRDEDEPPKESVRLPFFPGYFSIDPPVRSAIPPEVVYCFLMDYPPRKRVPVGPEHQAEIPGLEMVGPTATVQYDNGIMPSPDIGDGRTHCICLDQGSIRCVRQHIREARDKLRGTLGQDHYVELGFDDMGEVVAEKWSTEEEQLFHEVVSSNPASLGRNFWDALTCVFPSRTTMEIVSYYFNVFMLRKRAEQNRWDPMNIDSDNDEWEGIDDDGADEGGVSDEDEDSGVESLDPNDGLEFHHNGLHDYEDEHDEGDDNGERSDEAARETKSDPRSAYEVLDVQDGSCTSSDSGASMQGGHLNNDGWHEFIMDTSDVKAWDGYNNMSYSRSNGDFLPTCMIEEVFGDGDFELKSKRW